AGSIVGISQQTPTVGEEWAFVISVPFSAVSAEVSARSLGLLEPGSQALSDGIANVSIDIQEADLIMTFNLFSDNDLGQIGTVGPFFNTLTRTGLFNKCQTLSL